MRKNEQKGKIRDIDFSEIDISKDEYPDILEVLGSNPVKKLTHLILVQSIRDNASDFYMKRTKKGVILKYRIGCQIHKMMPPPSYAYEGIADEIKNLVSKKDDATITRIRVRGSGAGTLEAYVNLVNISESSLHLKFSYI